MFNDAKAKIDRCTFYFWKNDPIIFGTLSLLDKIPNRSYDTIGISTFNNKLCLYYNPNFINTVSNEKLELVLIIEAFRVLLKHPTSRLKEPKPISHLSSSLSIHQLYNDDFNMLMQGIDTLIPDPKQFGLEDKQCYEEYFRELLEKENEAMEQIEKIWNNMSEQQKQDAVNKAIEKHNENQPEDNSFKEFDNENDAIKEYTNPNGNGNQGWCCDKDIDSSINNFINKVKNKTRMWGKYTGNAKDIILQALEPKITCKDIIRRFGVSIITSYKESTRKRVNRRHDLMFPGYRSIYRPNIIFAIDTSGSMSDADLQYGFGIINKLLHFANITYILFDTEIKLIEKNFHRAKQNFSVSGRGGTDYNQIFEYADKQKADGMIVYTDGCADVIPKPKIKTLWLMSQKDQNPPVDWGFVTWLDRFSDDKI